MSWLNRETRRGGGWRGGRLRRRRLAAPLRACGGGKKRRVARGLLSATTSFDGRVVETGQGARAGVAVVELLGNRVLRRQPGGKVAEPPGKMTDFSRKRPWVENNSREGICVRNTMDERVVLEATLREAGQRQRAGELAEAERLYRWVLERNPRDAEACGQLGAVLLGRGRVQEAAACCQRAIALEPKAVQARHTFGRILLSCGLLEEAIRCYHGILAIEPGLAKAYNNLGLALQGQGRVEEAAECFRQATRLEPSAAMYHSNLLLALQYRMRPAEAMYREHVEWARRHGAGMRRLAGNERSPERRLRVGYLSGDFRLHSVAYFAWALVSGADRKQFEVYGYSDAAQEDGVTAKFRAAADQWRPIAGQSTEQVVEQVRRDGIDILVDLAGHMGANRLEVMARRPAPVQMTYLGYPGTTGLTEIDYRVTDAAADPPGQTEAWHSEALLRLAGGFLCYQPLGPTPEVNALPALRRGGVTLGSFNALAKLTPEMMGVWAGVLQRAPGARLLLKNHSFQDPATRERVARRFAAMGISAERVALRAPAPDVAAHLAGYHEMDIALDSFPYHGTTTTCEALWMGVPVVTLAGPMHVSRVGASLLRQVGLEDLVTQTPEAYGAMAVGLAEDLERLATLRATLRERMSRSPLMDVRGFMREFEGKLREVWRRYCAAGGRAGSVMPAERRRRADEPGRPLVRNGEGGGRNPAERPGRHV